MKIQDLDFWVMRYQPPEGVTEREIYLWQACLKLEMLKMVQAFDLAENTAEEIADAIRIAEEDVESEKFDLRLASNIRQNLSIEDIDRAARGEIMMLLEGVATDD